MKTKITVVCLGVLALWGQAQTQDSTASSGGASFNSSAAAVDRASLAVQYQVVERGADHRVMERKEFQKAPDGKVITQLHRYAQVATGLHYQNERGQWVESKAVIEALPDGSAAARQGQHQAFFPGNLYQGAVRLIMPDGRELTSRPIGLSYDDGEKMVMFAELKPASGQLKGANQVIYESAFTGVQADVIYTYRLDGFEQDIVLKKQPPTPESLGLKRETARLQVVTEFFNPPTPIVREAQLPSAVAQDVPDQTLDFGAMRMTAGRAFFQDKETLGQNVWVGKQWLEVEGRKILVEEVPLESVAADLSTLPLTAKLEKPMTPLLASGEWQLPPQRLATLVTNQPLMQVARADLPTAGLVLDYNTIIASASDYTFKADCTYYLTGDYWLMGKTTIEGGTVIKFAPTGNVALNIVGTLDCQTGPYRPAIFTSKNDDTVGEIIADSTGDPVIATNEAAGIFYSQDYYYVSNSAPISIHDCHFRYHKNAIVIANFSADAARTNEVRDCQFKSVRTALTVNGASTYAQNRVRNVLIDGAVMAFFIWNHQTVSVENATLRRVTYARLSSPSPSLITYTNCLFVCVTNLSEWNDNSSTLFATSCGTNASEAGVFQAAGGGNSYLATNSPYRNLGTTNIHPGLLAALKQKTTFAPVIYSNVNFAMPQTLAPQVPRDDDVPDLGYHYVPLDYVFGGCVLFTNLTVAPGTAVGWYAGFGSVLASAQPYGILLSDGAKLEFTGTASQPCWVAPFMAVQEAANGAWANRGWMGGIVLNGSDPTTAPRLNARFTKWSAVQGVPGHFRDNWAYGEANLSHCEFYSATIASYAPSLYFTNCFFHRVFVAFWSQQDSGSFTFKNCTFNEGCLAATRGYWNTPSSSNRWRIENTAFDGTCFSWWDDFAGDTNYTYLDFNAYNTNNLAWQDYPYPYPPQYGVFMTSGAHDVLVGGYQWQTSSQGNFYLPASSPLLNAGSQLASAAGLYHYTTQTNQVRETNSTVDIGYHTVALAPDGLPWSTYWNGMADYLADTNGDGGLGAWLTQYFGHLGVNPNDDSDADGQTNLQEYQAGSNPLSATMVFAWGDNSFGQCNVPAGLTNVIAVTANGDGWPTLTTSFSVGLKADGTVVAWGDNRYGQTNVPSGLGGVRAIAAGNWHTLALRTNGTMEAWGVYRIDIVTNGHSGFIYPTVAVPAGLSNVVSMSAGLSHDIALLNNGTVVAWGYDSNQPAVLIPTNLPPAKAVAAGWGFSAALLTNGSVVVWGASFQIPENLTNVTAIAASPWDLLTLKSDGTVIVLQGNPPIVFPGAQNIAAIANGYIPGLALGSNGVVLHLHNTNLLAVPDYPLENIQAIGAGWNHALAVRGGLLTPIITSQPVSQAVLPGANVTFTVQSVGLAGATYQWQSNSVNLLGATNTTLTLFAVKTNAAAVYRVVVNNAVGSVVSSNAVLRVYDVTVPVILSVSLPTNPVVNYGSNLALNVAAAANGASLGFPMAYQWWTNGVKIFGATASNFTFTVLGSRAVSVTVSNAVGGTNASWAVTAFYPGGVLIPNQPTNQYQVAGGAVTFVGSGVGSNALAFQWAFNGTAIAGATNASLTISNVSAASEGNYSYTLTDGTHSLTSSNATFTLVIPPTISAYSPVATNILAAYHTNLILSVAATAPGVSNGFPVSYRWRFNATNADGNMSSKTLFVDETISGNYFVVVSNLAGAITSQVWQVSMTYIGSYVAPGTLAYHLATNATARTNGFSNPYQATMQLTGWEYKDNYRGTNLAFLTNAVWSTNFWLKGVRGLSATPIGLITNNVGGEGLFTMVSPRHYLCATHMHPEGETAVFLDTNNVVHMRRTLERVDLAASNTFGIPSDLSVGILDSAVPESVGFLPVLPTNFTNYLPVNGVSYFQGVGMNQDLRVISQPMTLSDPFFVNWSSTTNAPFGLPPGWSTLLRYGDSSNPERLLIKNQLVLITHNSSVGGGQNYGAMHQAINNAMNYLSTNNLATNSFVLTPYVLTNWPTIGF